jgi:uncharacterized protein (TIGR00743 family)
LHRVLQPCVHQPRRSGRDPAALSKRARDVESDPCEIKSTFTEVEGGVKLDIDFVFACEAETLIFQLGLR